MCFLKVEIWCESCVTLLRVVGRYENKLAFAAVCHLIWDVSNSLVLVSLSNVNQHDY